MRFMTFNIQHALDFQKRVIDIELFAQAIRRAEADVCGLNEVRGFDAAYEGYTDQTNALGDALSMERAFAQAIRIEGPYGNAIVSRYPLRNVTVHPIPDPIVKDEDAYYETRCAVQATVCTPDGDITLIVCHMGLARSEAKNAVEVLCRLVDECSTPLVVMGDFNHTPTSGVLTPLLERMQDTADASPQAAKLTFPSNAPIEKIDYLLYRGLRCTNAFVIEEIVSDHFPIVADLELE